MNSIKTFNFNNQAVRTVTINDNPYFIGKDIAEILGYTNTRDALNKHVDEEDKQILTSQNVTLENMPNRGLTVINESGLYSLILSSKLEKAKEFKRWVTSEVLPTIRKNGAYLTDEKAYDITHNPQSLADLLLQAGEQLKQKELIIKELQPKALFADSVAGSNTSILIGQLAKLITQNGKPIGQNRLFNILRNKGYLSTRKGKDWNMPQQRYVEQGLFEIKESTHIDGNGVNITTKTPLVTGKGQIYFINKFISE